MDEALKLLGDLLGGATALPPGRGVWRDPDRDGILVFEEPVVIHCWISWDDLTEESLYCLGKFLRRLGRETRQGAIGLVLNQRLLCITNFTDGDP